MNELEKGHCPDKAGQVQKQALLQRVMKLSQKEKMVLDFLIVQEMSVLEAAKASGISVKMVHKVFRLALNKLNMTATFLDKRG